ncbi:MAG: creatininase family protein [candidate division Zixibacteria bacterium]|nr:creatininase family protein [candidate division Zixibacteria bacterium]
MSPYLDASTATWQECRDYLQAHPCAILPMGATEQHGPHLPQHTDTQIAEALARRVAEQSEGLILPALPFGYSWVWRDYPGTITFSFDTLRAVVTDIARSLHRNGCKTLMLLSTHGANPQPIKYTLRELADEMDMRLVNVFYPHLSDLLRNAESPVWQPMNFHAEEFETSILLYLHPEQVRMERAVREYPPVSDAYNLSNLPLGVLSVSGVFGDPTVATAEKGAQWLEACAQEIVKIWKRFLQGET